MESSHWLYPIRLQYSYIEICDLLEDRKQLASEER